VLGCPLNGPVSPSSVLKYDFNATRFNASLDYYVIDAEGFASNLSYFLGAGVYAGIESGSNDEDITFDMGLRMPVGSSSGR